MPYHLLRTQGITEFRGVRTIRHTFVKNMWGPWLLYDNEADPYQLINLIGTPGSEDLAATMECTLQGWLDKLGDKFEPGALLLEKAGLSHFWEANIPWGEWPNSFSQDPFIDPFMEPTMAKELQGSVFVFKMIIFAF